MAEFSQELPDFSTNFSETNQNNQSGGFPVLQEEELERQRSQNVNKNMLKSTNTKLNVFDAKQENLKTSVPKSVAI